MTATAQKTDPAGLEPDIPEGFRVRLVREAPAEAIKALYQAGGWWEDAPGAEAIIPKIIEGSFAFAVAEEISTGRIVGMGRILSDGVSDAYLQDLVVLEQFRRHHLGRALVRFLLNHCVRQGIGWIGIVCAPGTERFYDSLGIAGLSPMKGFVPRLYLPGKQAG